MFSFSGSCTKDDSTLVKPGVDRRELSPSGVALAGSPLAEAVAGLLVDLGAPGSSNARDRCVRRGGGIDREANVSSGPSSPLVTRKLHIETPVPPVPSSQLIPSPARSSRGSTTTLLASAGAQFLSPLQGVSLDQTGRQTLAGSSIAFQASADSNVRTGRDASARHSGGRLDLATLAVVFPLGHANAAGAEKPAATSERRSLMPPPAKPADSSMSAGTSGLLSRKPASEPLAAAPGLALPASVMLAAPGQVSPRSPVRGQLHLSSRALSGALSLLSARSPAESPSHTSASPASQAPQASPAASSASALHRAHAHGPTEAALGSGISGERTVTVSGTAHSRSPRASVSAVTPYLFAAATHAPATAASLLRASGSHSPSRQGKSHRSPSLGPTLSPVHSSARGERSSLTALPLPLPLSQSPPAWPGAGLSTSVAPGHIASFEAAFRGGRAASLSVGAVTTPLDHATAESAAAFSAALSAGEWSPGARALSRAAHTRGTAAVADSVRELLRADSRAGRSVRPMEGALQALRKSTSSLGSDGAAEAVGSFDDSSPHTGEPAAFPAASHAAHSSAALVASAPDVGHLSSRSAIGSGADTGVNIDTASDMGIGIDTGIDTADADAEGVDTGAAVSEAINGRRPFGVASSAAASNDDASSWA